MEAPEERGCSGGPRREPWITSSSQGEVQERRDPKETKKGQPQQEERSQEKPLPWEPGQRVMEMEGPGSKERESRGLRDDLRVTVERRHRQRHLWQWGVRSGQPEG